jgi:hypothetical protein
MHEASQVDPVFQQAGTVKFCPVQCHCTEGEPTGSFACRPYSCEQAAPTEPPEPVHANPSLIATSDIPESADETHSCRVCHLHLQVCRYDELKKG